MSYGKYPNVTVMKADGSYIPQDEPVFVLRAQDVLAPIAVNSYADLVLGATGDFVRSDEIRRFAETMSQWHTRKLPD